MVVGLRVQEGGEDSVRGVFCGRYCIEASSCGRIDFKDVRRPAGLEGEGCPAEVCRRSAMCSGRESFVRVRVSGQVGWSRVKYGGRKHDGSWLSNRCPICCHRDLLRRVGVRRCAVGPSVASRSVRIWPGCLGKQYSLFRVARCHGRSGVLDVRSVCAREVRQ